jgi:hypothetical protein
MSRFNTSSTHPLIPNSQNYMYEKKFVSIHSQDRDYKRFPNSNEFEVELPQDYCNVETVRLIQWAFPANYDVFAAEKNNILMIFKITKPYNPGEHMVNNPLLEVIFSALYENIDKLYPVLIEQGFYTPQQMSTELTNRFNEVVTNVVLVYLNQNPTLPNQQDLINQFIAQGGYNQFVVAYNSVGQKLWFGNKSSDFVLKNSEITLTSRTISTIVCNKDALPSYSNWGLPDYLGFSRCDATTNNSEVSPVTGLLGLPRFYYGDYMAGDNGYWIVPDAEYKGVVPYYLEAPRKINLMGDAYIYLDIDGLNNLDETSPWSISPYTLKNNPGTTGVVNSAFAKIAVPTTPISQWFDVDSESYKWYNPPAERIRKIKLKLRYHDGSLVEFGDFDFSITLEFSIFNPQISRKVNLYVPNII